MALNTNPAFRAPAAFQGQLNSNEVFSSIYNMIISQQVFSDNIKGLYDSLVNKFKIDGSLLGDTKLFYATDALKSVPWNGDSEAANLLSLDRPKDPSCQKVVIDQFRQIRLTVDNYLSKRAWADEGTFQNFQSVMLGWIGETKRIYESKLMNVFVGTVTGAADVNSISVAFTSQGNTAVEKEAANRLNAQAIAKELADLADEMKDAERGYNEYGYLRSYNPSDLIVVYNSEFANEITKVDIPTIFHQDGLGPISNEKLPAKYFGTVITASNIATYSASTPTAGKPINSSTGAYTPGSNHANGCVRTCYETDVTVGGTAYHLFPGDEIPSGTILAASAAAGTLAYSTIYIVDNTVICKVLHKNSIPFMSAFEASTEFWNPRSLTSNHYLTWGYSELTYLKNYPLITVKKA